MARQRARFRKGLDHFESSRSGTLFLEASRMSDEEKERLARELLFEFGATSVQKSRNGELRHSCVLPFGLHTNGDANPSADFNYQKLTYCCFGCGNAGGLLWLIGVCRGESTERARLWLESRTGVGADEQDLTSLLELFDALYSPKEQEDHYTPIPRMDERILVPWMHIHPYMTEVRGVPEDTLIRYAVGWDPQANRIVIPHFWEDSLVGWQTRRLANDGTPKYRSSPDFPKDSTLYGYDAEADEVIVVESPLSVLSKAHLGWHIEATFGALVTERQIRRIARHRKVILWMDNDEAGWRATSHLGEALTPYSEVWVVDSPWAADPADLDDDEYARLLKEAVIPYPLWSVPTDLKPWRSETDGPSEVRHGQDPARA